MKKIIFLLIILFFGCQKAASITDNSVTQTNSEVDQFITLTTENNTCEALFRDVILSSDLETIKKFKDIFIRIENVSENKITLELYTKNNLSQSLDIVQNVENAIAWLEFLPESLKLNDITSDPDEPVAINYDKDLVAQFDFQNTCGVKEIVQEDPKKGISKTNCETITGDMISGEKCLISNTNIQEVYQDMISNKLVDDTSYLEKTLPGKSLKKDMNNNGLIVIEYLVTKKNTLIRLGYDGGETTIELAKLGADVMRTITYSAD